jgi:MFS family permease
VTDNAEVMDAPAGPVAAARIPAASWYALGVLTLVNVFSFMDRTAIAILLEPIKIDLGLTDSQLGLLSGMAFVVLYTVLGIPLARAADRSSRVKLLAACFAVWSAMTTACGLARNFLEMFLARMGVGVGEAGCYPAAHSLIGDYFPAQRRAFAVGIFLAGAAFGGSIGLYFIGLLGQEFGWRPALQFVGIAGAPVILLVLLTVKEPPRPATTKELSGERFLSVVRALFARRALVHLIIGYSLVHLGTAGMGAWVPTFLVRSFGMGLAEIGAWFGAATAVGSMSGLVAGGWLVNQMMRRDPRWEIWMSATGYFLCLPFYVVMVLAPVWWMVIVFASLGAMCSGMGASATLSAVQSFAEPRRRATAIAVVLFISGLLGSGGGPYVIGILTDVLTPQFGKESLRYGMLSSVAMMAPGIIFLVLSGLRSPKDRVA